MSDSDDEIRRERKALIADTYEGIYPAYEAFYIQSIIYAAERSLAAFQAFDRAVETSRSAALIVAPIQEGLTHAGALSRFFWPVRKDDALAAARGRRLRSAFGIDEASPLKWRKLRNAFEHYDEDLDRFLLDDRVGHFFPSPLVADHALADEETGHIFKLVDPASGLCVLLGVRYEYEPIRNAVEEVISKAALMDRNGGRLALAG